MIQWCTENCFCAIECFMEIKVWPIKHSVKLCSIRHSKSLWSADASHSLSLSLSLSLYIYIYIRIYIYMCTSPHLATMQKTISTKHVLASVPLSQCIHGSVLRRSQTQGHTYTCHTHKYRAQSRGTGRVGKEIGEREERGGEERRVEIRWSEEFGGRGGKGRGRNERWRE